MDVVTTPHLQSAPKSGPRPPHDECPTCGQPITHLVFEEIQAKLVADELKHKERAQRFAAQEVAKATAEAESMIKARLAAADKVATERETAARLETRKEVEAMMAPKLAAAEAAHRGLEALKKATAEREAAARVQARKRAEAELAPRLAAGEAAKKELAETKRTVAAREAAARTAAKKEVEAAFAPRLAAGAAATKELAEVKAASAKELRDVRSALEKDRDQAVKAEKARAFKKDERLHERIASLTRQLEHKTADELGEGAEVDVFEQLRADYPTDIIKRVKKGEAGADIVHEVIHNGRTCGTIVYDSKNRDAWRNDYVTKLRDDQIAAHAEHAILSTRAFPAGSKQLVVRDGVIVANPARVVALVGILRGHLVQASTRAISSQARDEKAAELYAFITSDRCNQLFGQMETAAANLGAIDAKEMTTHQKTWSDRGILTRKLEKARIALEFEIEQITGIAAEEQSA